MRLLLLASVQILSACAYNLPAGMRATTTLYDDMQKLYAVCGTYSSCVVTDFETYCHRHLRTAANGDALAVEHETTHCAGRLDAPEIRKGT